MSLLNNSGVDYIEGRGRLVDAHTVDVGRQGPAEGGRGGTAPAAAAPPCCVCPACNAGWLGWLGVELMRLPAVLPPPACRRPQVGGRRVTARNILIATGARAFVPPFPGAEHCIISDNALEVQEVRGCLAVWRQAWAGGV